MFRAPHWHGATQTHFPRAAQIPMALRHHERNFAAPSAHTLEANISRDTTNHPAHQRHVAFTPAWFALPSGTAPRKRTSHQGRPNPNGTATSRTSCRHTICPHTTSVLRETSSKSHAYSLQNEHFVRDFQQSHVKSPKRAFRTRLPQKLPCQSLQNERFVRDFLQKSSGNTHRSTHITHPCQEALSRFQSLQTTPAHTPIPMSQRHSPLPQLTTSRFPAPATKLPQRAQSTAPATKYHLRHASQLHDSLHLP